MKVKELIKKLLECPMDNNVNFVTFENQGYSINELSTSKITNITWLSRDKKCA